MVGKGLSAEETRAVIKSLRQRLPDKSFSDRLLYDEAELDRANEYLLKNPLAYLPDPERSRAIWKKVDAYCAKIGFDICRPDTWKLPRPRLELAKSETILHPRSDGRLAHALHNRNCQLPAGASCPSCPAQERVGLQSDVQVLGGAWIPGTNTRASQGLQAASGVGLYYPAAQVLSRSGVGIQARELFCAVATGHGGRRRRKKMYLLYLSRPPSVARTMTTWNSWLCGADGVKSASGGASDSFLSKNVRRRGERRWGQCARGWAWANKRHWARRSCWG